MTNNVNGLTFPDYKDSFHYEIGHTNWYVGDNCELPSECNPAYYVDGKASHLELTEQELRANMPCGFADNTRNAKCHIQIVFDPSLAGSFQTYSHPKGAAYMQAYGLDLEPGYSRNFSF